jgi:hypothetical protein
VLTSPLADGLLGAVIGAVAGAFIAGFFILYQTRILLREESKRREQERESETKAVAAALLWEIDDFYRLSIRDVYNALKDKNPADLSFEVKSQRFRSFPIYEAVANKVGLFEPPLIGGIVGFFGTARAYLDTIHDYGQALEQLRAGQQEYLGKAVELLRQIKASSESFVAPAKTITEALATRASVTEYKFEAPKLLSGANT